MDMISYYPCRVFKLVNKHKSVDLSKLTNSKGGQIIRVLSVRSQKLQLSACLESYSAYFDKSDFVRLTKER